MILLIWNSVLLADLAMVTCLPQMAILLSSKKLNLEVSWKSISKQEVAQCAHILKVL